ncbi:MAG: hypothetical protein HY815_08460 [Candidatus Riflebacteria bacterium]|nr:hypothetical protein [Candidatus Riflebacteria bacterium]
MLQHEVATADGPDEVVALLVERGPAIVRIKRGGAELTAYLRKGDGVVRALEKGEIQELRALLGRADIDRLGPYREPGQVWSVREILHIAKGLGHRVAIERAAGYVRHADALRPWSEIEDFFAHAAIRLPCRRVSDSVELVWSRYAPLVAEDIAGQLPLIDRVCKRGGELLFGELTGSSPVRVRWYRAEGPRLVRDREGPPRLAKLMAGRLSDDDGSGAEFGGWWSWVARQIADAESRLPVELRRRDEPETEKRRRAALPSFREAVGTLDGRGVVFRKLLQGSVTLESFDVRQGTVTPLGFHRSQDYTPIVFVEPLRRVLLAPIARKEWWETLGESGSPPLAQVLVEGLRRLRGPGPQPVLVDPYSGKVEPVDGDLWDLCCELRRPHQPRGTAGELWMTRPDAKTMGTEIGLFDARRLRFRRLGVLPGCSATSAQVWVDEPSGVAYVAQGEYVSRHRIVYDGNSKRGAR